MTNQIEARIDTYNPLEIPTIGQRKRVRVNGKFEFMTVNKINVWRCEDYETGKRRNLYRATVTFGHYDDVTAA